MFRSVTFVSWRALASPISLSFLGCVSFQRKAYCHRRLSAYASNSMLFALGWSPSLSSFLSVRPLINESLSAAFRAVKPWFHCGARPLSKPYQSSSGICLTQMQGILLGSLWPTFDVWLIRACCVGAHMVTSPRVGLVLLFSSQEQRRLLHS